MKMDKIANSGNDEYYTPLYAIKPIVKYLKKGSTVWCPFDTDDSLYVKYLKENGFKVLNSHIEDGIDFFNYIKDFSPICDYIISNPPYSIKTEVLQALFDNNKPFAMLVGVVGIFESQKRFDMFKLNKFEIMYFNRRVGYMNDYTSGKCALSPPFSSVYVCNNILPSQIVFESINKKEILINNGE